MKITLISSKSDIAGQNIHSHIHRFQRDGIPGSSDATIQQNCQYEHLLVEGRLIFQDDIDHNVDSDLLVFLSRHASVNPLPVLTVHVTGNFGRAEVGGRDNSLAPAAPEWMHAILKHLNERAPKGYDVSYEVTHHGPTGLHIPSCFVEIGSTEQEWRDEQAGAAVAAAVLLASPDRVIPMISFGGTHYARRQTKIALKTRGAFGHIAHTREVPGMTREKIRDMMEKTHAVAAHIDRKALAGSDLTHLEGLLREEGITRLGEHELTGIGVVPWEHYLGVRALAESVDPECSLHFHLLERIDQPVIAEINRDLIGAALSADTRGFLQGLHNIPSVHLTTSKSPVLPVFITDQNQKAQILHDLITLCVSTIIINEETAVEGDYLVIRKRKLDPLKAHEMGVPAGPLFGLLMKGERVNAGGKIITPDMVQVCSERKIHIPGLESYT